MKSLYKKIGVVALSSALVMGGAFGGSSLLKKSVSNIPVSDAAPSSIRVPFLLESQLKHASKEQIARNDIQMVIGLRDIFGYDISLFNPSDHDIRHLAFEDNVYIGKIEKGFDDANKFLSYLFVNGVKEGMHRYRIGRQDLVLVFFKDVEPQRMWWLYLDKWLYAAESYLKDIKINY